MDKHKFKESIVCEEGRKGFMEDTFCFLRLQDNPAHIFGGVYDGHKGDYAANYAKKRLHKIFFNELEKGKNEHEAFKRAYEETSLEVSSQDSGTTATNFYINNNVVHWANAGDGRLVVFSDKKAKQLTQDHRADNDKERERILSFGGEIKDGFVIKGGGGIEPTRTIGDEYFKDAGVISTPDTGTYKMAPDDLWVLAGTDGVFDFVSNEKIFKVLKKYNNSKEASAALKNKVLGEAMGTDNTTFILLKTS